MTTPPAAVSPLLLRATEHPQAALAPALIEDLVRAEQDGTPSILWVEAPEQLETPLCWLVTHVGLPEGAGPALRREVCGRVGAQQVVQAAGPDQ
ncbi:hypothetical protein, partial [Nesterenkonia sp. PF2B19]|uniref:hypothetical protein n=1 Tax=Nesterenkonia sp. PF2B19 TaxID=1881858 RepID=UPI000A24B28C